LISLGFAALAIGGAVVLGLAMIWLGFWLISTIPEYYDD
jgi:hypothetical protein